MLATLQTWRLKALSRMATAAQESLRRGRLVGTWLRRAAARASARAAVLGRRSTAWMASKQDHAGRLLRRALTQAAASGPARLGMGKWRAIRPRVAATREAIARRLVRVRAAIGEAGRAGWHTVKARAAKTPLEPAFARADKWLVTRRQASSAGRYRIVVSNERPWLTKSAIAVVLCVLVALPAFASRNLINDLIFVFTMLALAQYWNLLAGYAGLVSVGQQAFVGLGGYLLFALSVHGQIDPLLAIALAGIFSAVLALPTALVVFRLRGAYFAIGTWVMAEVYRLVFAQFRQLGGGTGTSLPPHVTNEVAGITWVKALLDVRTSAARDMITYWAALTLVAGTILLVYLILRSRYGLALTAIRDSEAAAESVGVDNFKTKLKVYIATAAGTGMIGALIYLQKARISPDAAFSVLDWTAYVIFIVVIGGIGTIEGPIIGVLVFYVLQTNLAHFGTWYLMLLGLFAIATMLFAPKGIWGFLSERYGLAIFPTRRRLVANDKESAQRT